jgi:hypothetical protein
VHEIGLARASDVQLLDDRWRIKRRAWTIIE